MKLLAPFQLTFGFISAYNNLFVNGEILSKAIGTNNVGYMAAVLPAVATFLSIPYSKLANIIGKKWLLIFASLNWIAIALSIAIPSKEYIIGLKWKLVYVYILLGSGRAVFEATNKAVFADLFKDNKEEAFANLGFLSGISGALGFFIFPYLTKTYKMRWIMAGITIFSGVVAIIGILRVYQIVEQKQSRDEMTASLITDSSKSHNVSM